jgi:hypothetical protein
VVRTPFVLPHLVLGDIDPETTVELDARRYVVDHEVDVVENRPRHISSFSIIEISVTGNLDV